MVSALRPPGAAIDVNVVEVEMAEEATSGRGRAAPHAAWGPIGECEHLVQFYEADAVLIEAVSGYVGTALQAGEIAIVIATPPHRAALDEALRADGLDPDVARARGDFVTLDAEDTLARFMVDGQPEPTRFRAVVGALVARAAESERRVWAFGEMVALLAATGRHVAALRLESLWNDLQRQHTFALLCAYPMDVLAGEELSAVLDGIGAEHARVMPAESFTRLDGTDAQLREIARLQQKAASLEAELAERHRLLLREQAARAEAEAALRQRDEFLSIASHELRTPVATISAHAQLAVRQLRRRSQLEPERVEQAFTAMMRQSDKLSCLLGRLLDVSQLDAGKLSLERQQTDLTALAREVVAAAQARTIDHTITLVAPPALAADVDPLRLEQVLTNLLENAVKYSPDGGPIAVELCRHPYDVAEISVQDAGLGIPPEKRARLFERYYQAHGDGYRSGMGLGLYVSSQIVALHGGEIGAEFPENGGCRFFVRLPLD